MRRSPIVTAALLTLFAVAQCDGGSQSLETCRAASCSGRCVELSSDNENCGACGFACPPSTRCTAGACSSLCRATESKCVAGCADLASDVRNCGACGLECAPGKACSSGSCVDCAPTQALCSANGQPYCANLSSDDANCGSCGAVCPMGQVCMDSACNDPCKAGLVYCAPSSCVDVATDSTNCGTCGHDCLGSACDGGRCVPTVLATNQDSPTVLAVDSGTLYWAHGDNYYVTTGIRYCAVAGCGNHPTDLTPAYAVTALDVSNGAATWHEAAGIFRCSLNDCANPSALLYSQWPYLGPTMAVDAANVYVTANQFGAPNGAVWRCSLKGCANQPTTITNQATSYPMAIAVDGANVYWGNDLLSGVADALSLSTCSLAGCGNGGPKVLVSQAGQVRQLVADATTLYWIDEAGLGSIMSCAKSGCNDNPTILASSQGGPWAIAVDGANVYWSNSTAGAISKCPVAGCNGKPTIVAAGVAQPRGIALDAQWVYFAEYGSATISKVAK